MSQSAIRTRVVCHVEIRPEEHARFVWSDGAATFEPYVLENFALNRFLLKASQARALLKDLAIAHVRRGPASDEVLSLCGQLAQAGRGLYKCLFELGQESNEQSRAEEARRWLEDLSAEGQVDSLEILLRGPSLVPWNVVHPAAVDPNVPARGPDFWGQFWGVHHNLAVGRNVSPLRRLRVLDDPKVLFVLDPAIVRTLGDEAKELSAFVEEHEIRVETTLEGVRAAYAEEPPDLLYWFGHATPKELVLGSDSVSPEALFDILSSRERGRGIAFLNACQTGQQVDSGGFLNALLAAGVTGLIATEELTVNTFANRFGFLFLRDFLGGGRGAAEVLRSLRAGEQGPDAGVPLGLLYTTFCPPALYVGSTRFGRRDSRPLPAPPDVGRAPAPASTNGHSPGPLGAPPTPFLPAAQRAAAATPLTLGAALSPEAPDVPHASDPSIEALPPQPYPSLSSYARSDRPLFAGRDLDIERFAALLDASDYSTILLHGESGVGKSSFLLAGVIPFVEDDCSGYRFFRSRDGGATDDSVAPVLFVRSTADPAEQIARALCVFCATPLSYTTPRGATVTVDLPALLGDTIGEPPAPLSVHRWLAGGDARLGALLTALTKALPYSLVLVLDQCEEIFTLGELGEPADDATGAGASPPRQSAVLSARRSALAMLRGVQRLRGNFKVILSLRTEYAGRLVGGLRGAGHERARIAEYFLPELDRSGLEAAIVRPTTFERYAFDYEGGVAATIAGEILGATRGYRDSALPLLQVVCTQLYDLVSRAGRRSITLADYAAIGGVSGGMRRHVETLVRDLARGAAATVPSPASATAVLAADPEARVARIEAAFRKLCARLYLEQPDGTLTTALTSLDYLEKRWATEKCEVSLRLLVTGATEMKLLRLTMSTAADGGERTMVSLSHDALAVIARAWDQAAQDVSRRNEETKTRRWLASIALFAVGCASALGVWLWLSARNVQILTHEAEALHAKAVREESEYEQLLMKSEVETRRLLELHAKLASTQAKLDDSLNDFEALTTSVATLPTKAVTAVQSDLAAKGDERGSSRVTLAVAPGGASAAWWWAKGYQAYLQTNKLDAKSAEFKAAWTTARESYAKALAIDPSFARAINSLGRMAQDEGNSPKAEELYRQALAADPRYLPALYNLAQVDVRANNLDEAETLVRRAEEIRPGYAKDVATAIAYERKNGH